MSATPAESIDWLQTLDGEWLKLPLAAMRDVGPAVQTLGGLLAVTNRSTFAAVESIAAKARLPTKTARNHLAVLAERGWITNEGRQRTPRGAPRRTCTLALSAEATAAAKDYGVLPWWACCRGTKGGALSWSARAVLALVAARLMSVVSVARNDGHPDMVCDDVWGTLENMGDRFGFSLEYIGADTGLSRPSICAAKMELSRRRIIDLRGGARDDGGTDRDSLWPSEAFRVGVRPASEGRCYVDF